MSRRFTLDEYLDAFTNEETESLPDAISVRISDAQVRRLGFVFLNLMGGVLQCLRKPPRRSTHAPASKLKTKNDLCEELADNGSNQDSTDGDDIIH